MSGSQDLNAADSWDQVTIRGAVLGIVGCLSTFSTSTTRCFNNSPPPVMTIKTGFRYCQMSPRSKIATSGEPSMCVSFKGKEEETRKKKEVQRKAFREEEGWLIKMKHRLLRKYDGRLSSASSGLKLPSKQQPDSL